MSNFKSLTGAGGYSNASGNDMEYYDKLPKEIRDYLKNANTDICCVNTFRHWRFHGNTSTLNILKEIQSEDSKAYWYTVSTVKFNFEAQLKEVLKRMR